MEEINQSVTSLKAGMACQGQSLKLIAAILNLKRKCSVVNTGPGLAHEHQMRLERPARDKHSSLLQNIYILRR
jgi:hypothetical protein